MCPRSLIALATMSLALGCLVAPRPARAEAAPIFLDGTFGDWTGPVEHVDAAGDAFGVDLRALDLANDDAFLFVRFQTTGEIGIQDGVNRLVLFLDTDRNAATGLPIGGIGAELQWNFGTRSGCFLPQGSCVGIDQNALRLRMLPSVTAGEFEIAIGRDVRPDGVNPLFAGASFRALLHDGGSGDYAPDSGGLDYTFDPAPVPPPMPLSFTRLDPGHLRVVTWNARDLESGAGWNPAVTPAADRVLSAIDPDVLCFQELYNTSAEQVRTLVAAMLPDGAPWHAAKHNDCAVVSRHPVLQSWTLDGNLAVLIDADPALGRDLLVVCAHLPCCTNDAGRQREIDRILAFWRDAMTAGGSVTVPAGTGFLIAGDLNLVGMSQQLRSLLTGDIVEESVYGPDFAPDWDGTTLADVISSQTERRFAYTWRSDGNSFAPGRLDFLIHGDSALRLRHHFIVHSAEMSADARAATGIQPADVTTVSDHLPHVADFSAAAEAGVGGSSAGRLALGTAVGRGEIRFSLELGIAATVTIDVFDLRGRRVRSLAAGPLAPGRHALTWDGTVGAGAAAPVGIYFARAVATPAGGGPPARAGARWVLLR